ncbi:gliding motility protein GldM [Candidatus Amoebophilus asiaticus]|nr:gliding motility protein GldM [Candidatus Amoebophilus asiaticus]
MSGGGYISPRQKMINMMYLVLTALLALNVSREVLNAFIKVDEGLQATQANFQTQNDITYASFEAAMKNNPDKTKPYRDNAFKAKDISDKLITHIEDLKDYTVKIGGGWDEDILEEEGRKVPQKKSDLDVGGQVMDLEGKGKELQDMVNSARANFLGLVSNEADRKRVEELITLKADDPPPGEEGAISWAQDNFVHIPLAAYITQLSKLQLDIKNAEGVITNYLFKAIDAADFKFDKLEPKIIAQSSYILLGQEYKADVFLSASSSTQDPDIFVGRVDEEGKLIGEGQKLDSVVAGIGKYVVRPVAEGIVKWGGVIKIKNPQGEVEEYPFQSEFQAAKPSASVSLTKMNVMYIGVDNPVEVSAPGFPKDKVTASLIGSGSLSGGKGKYIGRVNKVGKVKIVVTAETASGDKKRMGEFDFRVKRVPDPVAQIGKKEGGVISREVLRVQGGISAVLIDFDFDVRYTVIRHNITYLPKRGDPKVLTNQKGALFSARAKSILKNCKAGDRIIFDEIFARMPKTKDSRKLNSIFFTVK